MKKILIILCCLVITHVNATEMCARDDTVVIPLDAVATQDTATFNLTEYMWRATFKYGNIYGTSTCLSITEIQEFDPSWNGTGNVPNILPTDNDEIMGRTGTDTNGNPRQYCFIKMTHPMSSKWKHSEASCSNCLNGSMHNLKQQPFRTALFNSVLE